jgi:toxin ParE1/3/4
MKIEWSRRAVQHLAAIRNYIGKDSPESAERLAARILDAIDFLAANPQMGRPGRLVGTRELVVLQTAYIVQYRVKEGRLEPIAAFLESRSGRSGFDQPSSRVRTIGSGWSS